jgi:hypothetical protein
MQTNNRHVVVYIRIAAVCGAALVAVLLAPIAHAGNMASDANRLTFSRSVALPGVTLPAGSYTFELVDPSTGMVRVVSPDRRRAYFMGFTIAVRRPSTLSATQPIVLREAPAGAAPPIAAWYPIGTNLGREFLYR